MTAICSTCFVQDELRALATDDGSLEDCSACGALQVSCLTVDRLGARLHDAMRYAFEFGRMISVPSHDDDETAEVQAGVRLSELVAQVLEKQFEFHDEIVNALMAADDFNPEEGGEPLWIEEMRYEKMRFSTTVQSAQWSSATRELKSSRRFFSPIATTMFEDLFANIDNLTALVQQEHCKVVDVMPKGTPLYRAREMRNRAEIETFVANPRKELGPPPAHLARAGRMNAEGIVVFYSATDSDTSLAEIRPALTSDIAQAVFCTTRPLRILYFDRLEQARLNLPPSIFSPSYVREMQRRAFLSRLHSLISQPVKPGFEIDYLITQTMAEYLVYVSPSKVDGIAFASAQNQGGENIVLFQTGSELERDSLERLGIEYVRKTIEFFRTKSVKYDHTPLHLGMGVNRKLNRLYDPEEFNAEDWGV